MRADPFLRSPACNFLKILESKGKKKKKEKKKEKEKNVIYRIYFTRGSSLEAGDGTIP